jgi:DNA-binding transcriptional regulator YiaG
MELRDEGRTEPRRETRLPFGDPNYMPPTPAEFRAVNQLLGLTGSQAGTLLGVTSRAIRKWIGGESDVPYSAWRLLLIEAGLALGQRPSTLSNTVHGGGS